jgi:hypothetical protein
MQFLCKTTKINVFDDTVSSALSSKLFYDRVIAAGTQP